MQEVYSIREALAVAKSQGLGRGFAAVAQLAMLSSAGEDSCESEGKQVMISACHPTQVNS